MTLAPVVLFVYNRPFHTKLVVDSLLKNHLAKDTELFIFSDGPRNEDAVPKVDEVREYIYSVEGFAKVEIVCSDVNRGLSGSIVEGVTQLVNRYGKVIVLEDDLKTSPFFLTYMNESLVMFEQEDRVACVHGYVYPLKRKVPETFFIKGADCWGWGTWKRAWDLYDPNGQKLLDELVDRKLEYEFNFKNSFPYTEMLKDQIAGRNDSWAIRWYAAAFLRGKFVLYPGKSLVQNIGNDSSGTHSETTARFDVELYESRIRIDARVVLNDPAYNAFVDYFRTFSPRKSFLSRMAKAFRDFF